MIKALMPVAVVFSLLAGSQGFTQTIKYVKPVASGTGDGSSWANASANLKAIIDGAAANTQIWVAAGTYKPTTGTDRTVSFVMENNLAIYGGFAGTETQLAQRNWNTNETILSGDIGIAGDMNDNSYHVVLNHLNYLNNTAILDGFTVTAGNGKDDIWKGGGGINNSFSNSPAIINCKFINNSSYYSGGAIFNYDHSSPYILNCMFLNNGGGPTIYNFYISSPVITNCSISGSPSVAIQNKGGSNPTITNSIIWGNQNDIINGDTSLPTVNYSILQSSYAGTGNLNVDPQFVSQSDLRLQTCSPAQDAGNDAANPATTDLAGNPRKFNGKLGPTLIDMGAYELQAVCQPTLFVKTNAAGNNNGSSWANAFTNLQDALEQARQFEGITQIWVAAGTYKPTTGSDRAVSFVMRNSLAIYGGFAGTETQLAQRSWITNETILSGDIGATGNSADNSYNVISNNNNALNNTAILDGFTITAGNANGPSRYSQGGGGISNNLSFPIISHCNFIDNKANFGGALDVIGSGTRVTECRFSGNTATIQGGAININSASVPIINSSFLGNTADNGGALYFDGQAGGAFKLTNCSISGNAATSAGGAVFVNYGPSFIDNSIIWGNSSGVAIGPYGQSSISYSIVQGGYAGTGNLDADPQFVQQPPVGLGTTGNLRLKPCSPVINGGNDAANATAFDLDGNARKFGTIDRGAYERQSPKPTTWYLDSAATGNGDGSNWANAFTSLSDALSNLKTCNTSDTLLIAKGTYNTGSPFEFDRLQGVILGGYPTGGGNQRDPAANRVNIPGVVNLRQSMRIDGIKILTPKN